MQAIKRERQQSKSPGQDHFMISMLICSDVEDNKADIDGNSQTGGKTNRKNNGVGAKAIDYPGLSH